ncbi:MAG: hypothetical protein IT577_08350 [Verrucomicrobiae bacterium]|nr:hypothetical protein [Verrucomicrobiae bacterium]
MGSGYTVTSWHHAPLHIFLPNTIYMVTAATLRKENIYSDARRLAGLQQVLFDVFQSRCWELRAWAVFSNHYHVIAKSPERGGHIRTLVQHMHSDASRFVNALDGTPGRRVWYQYWDRCLTFEKSYYPRLNYVIHNAVRHGLVPVASRYPFCSAASFEATIAPAFQKKVRSFRCDHLGDHDDFQPVWTPDDAA